MVILIVADPIFVRWRNKFASLGMVVIGVEFRNTGGEWGNHPFPAGVEDRSSGIKWVYGKPGELAVSKSLVSSESVGGNLSIATALRVERRLVKRDRWNLRLLSIYLGPMRSLPLTCLPYLKLMVMC